MLPVALYYQSSRFAFRSSTMFIWRCLSSSTSLSSHLIANQSTRQRMPTTMAVIINGLLTRHLQTSAKSPSPSRSLVNNNRTPNSRESLDNNKRRYLFTRSPTTTRKFFLVKLGSLISGCCLIALGFYQGYQEYMQENTNEPFDYDVPPVPLPKTNAEILELQNRRVILRGRFEHESEQFLASRKNLQIPSGQYVPYWNQDGYYVLTPFILSDGTGRRLLVNRGWIATHRKDPAKRPLGQVVGEVTINAYVTGAEEMDFFSEVRSTMRMQRWHYSNDQVKLDIGMLSRKLALNPVAVFVADKESTLLGGPVGGQLYVPTKNEFRYIRTILLFFSGAVLVKAVFL